MGMRVLNLVCKKRELIQNKYDKNTMSRENVVRAEKSRQNFKGMIPYKKVEWAWVFDWAFGLVV